MELPNAATVTASWIPKQRKDGSTFEHTHAGYKKHGAGEIRLDNSHEPDVLHTDYAYCGRTVKHKDKLPLAGFTMVNRRRVTLVRLLQILEAGIDWRIPAWFYMPFCIWWPELASFPDILARRKPSSISNAIMCETVFAYLCLKTDGSREFLFDRGITKHTLDGIDDAIEHVSFLFEKGGVFEMSQIVFGQVTIIPFPMYAPPGSTIQGHPAMMGQLV